MALPSCLGMTGAPGGTSSAVDAGRSELRWPSGDPLRGKRLFVTKGCFICHAVHGAGGFAAPSLDAPQDGRIVDPMIFAAAMWQGASAMLTLQLLELGYQIGVTGDELRDLAAFASDADIQADFSLKDIPEGMRDWMIDVPYWAEDSWPEPFRRPLDEGGPPYDDL